MNIDATAFIKKAKEVLGQVSGFMKNNRFVFGDLGVDHLCYKCGSREEFLSLMEIFEHNSVFIYQSVISGRSIAIVGVLASWNLRCNGEPVNILEIQDQNPYGTQKPGFTHVEMDLGTKDQTLYKLVLQRLRCFGVKIHRKESDHHPVEYVLVPEISDRFQLRFMKMGLAEKIARFELGLGQSLFRNNHTE